MYISEIILDNFKSFQGCGNKISLNSGINFLVGENNTGKTTILSAINFITDKKLRSDVISTSASDNDHVSVEICIRGRLNEIIEDNASLQKLKPYIQTDDDGEYMTVKRSSKYEKVNQGNKEVELTIEKVRVYNPVTEQFENPSGFDGAFKPFLGTQFVWADEMPSEYIDFGATKLCGKLINAAAKPFFESEKWNQFQSAHKDAFSNGPDSLEAKVTSLAGDIEKIIKEQYGKVGVKFQFSLPDVSGFLKSGDFLLEDDGVSTTADSKGTGLQRALALAVIQLYAKSNSSVPLIFLLDEPETFLHPRAQDKLIEALRHISENNQIFITTHSPYLLKSFNGKKDRLFIFSKSQGKSAITSSSGLNTFGRFSPTLGEINYYAFNVLSVEFHNELYGYIQSQKAAGDAVFWKQEDFDKYLATCQGFSKNKLWKRNDVCNHNGYHSTLATYIRDSIHHPENTLNQPYTDQELKSSIENMLNIIKNGIN